MANSLISFYFSPTGTTKQVINTIAKRLSGNFPFAWTPQQVDFTLPSIRKQPFQAGEGDLVVAGIPVYAGRVPNILLKYLETMTGNGAKAIAIVLYGNRNFDDALIEWRDLLTQKDFSVFAAAAFIGEHAFSRTLAKERPDAEDLTVAQAFADRICQRLAAGNTRAPVEVEGQSPYRPYYQPRSAQGEPVDIRKVKPKTNERCTNCCICSQLCPMGSISSVDSSEITGICIKCGACVKSCPAEAKYFDDPGFLYHKQELEEGLTRRAEPQCFS